MSLIAWLEFELANYDVAVQHISLHATGILPHFYCKRELYYPKTNLQGLVLLVGTIAQAISCLNNLTLIVYLGKFIS